MPRTLRSCFTPCVCARHFKCVAREVTHPLSSPLNRPSFRVLLSHSSFSFVIHDAASEARACEDHSIEKIRSARHALFRAQSAIGPHCGRNRGGTGTRHTQSTALGLKAGAGKISRSPASLAWLNVTPFRDLLKRRQPSQAVAAEVENWYEVSSRHIAYMITASFRATAATAFLCPLRCAILIPHALRLDQPLYRVSMLLAAS